MSALEIIAEQCDGAYSEKRADRILTSLATHGFRLIPPGSLDRETIEKCAALIEDHDILGSGGGQELRPRKEGNRFGWAYADAIRALGAEK